MRSLIEDWIDQLIAKVVGDVTCDISHAFVGTTESPRHLSKASIIKDMWLSLTRGMSAKWMRTQSQSSGTACRAARTDEDIPEANAPL